MTSLCQVDMKHPSLFGGGTLCSSASRLLPFGSGAHKSPATWHHCYFSCEKYQDVNLELNVDNSAFYHQFAIAQVGGVLGRKRSGHAGDGGGDHNRQNRLLIPGKEIPDSAMVGPLGEVQARGAGRDSPPYTHLRVGWEIQESWISEQGLWGAGKRRRGQTCGVSSGGRGGKC